MMLEPPLKDMLQYIPSRYELVNVIACRARQIAREAEDEHVQMTEKPVSLAINEAAEGLLHPVEDED